MRARIATALVLTLAACGADTTGSVADGDTATAETAADSAGTDDADATAADTAAETVGETVGDTAPDPDVAPPDCDPGCVVDCPQGCFDLGSCAPSASVSARGAVFTAGVRVAPGTTGTALYYRPTGSATWWRGHDLARTADGGLGGVIFWLRPATDYEVRVEGAGCADVTTAPLDPPATVLATLHVAAGAAAGGDGSAERPFATIGSALAAASAGSDIQVAAGVYRESVAITKSGSPGRYLRLVGAPGAILEGADADVEAHGLAWSAQGGGVWRAAWAGAPSYLARDGVRSYHYMDLAGLEAGLGDDDVPIAEGWFVEDGALWVRSSDDPAGHQWQVPALDTAFALDGAAWIWIEGFEIRNYGEGEYPKGIDIRDSSHVVVRRNHIHETSSPIWSRRGSEDVRIEDNELHQSAIFDWPWDALKGTDHENSAISLQGGSGAIVSGNRIHDIFNGVYAGDFSDDDPAIAPEVDVYDNAMWNIGDDGLEPEGACVNHRYWRNTIDRMQNGISLAPIVVGPVFALRNRMSDYRQSGFKVSNDTSGPVFLYHNTSWVGAAEHNGMNVSGPFQHLTFRNNIIAGTFYSIEMSLETGPPETNDLDYDDLYTTRGAPVIKWQDVRYDSIAELCDAAGLECHGSGAAPALLDPEHGRFAPSADSPGVNRGLHLYGIDDDFVGAAPDMGYVELGAPEPPPR